MKKIVVLLVVLLGCMPVTAFAQKQFIFLRMGRFVVAQFTDLHWMPGSAKCAETAATYPCCPGSRTSGHCYTEWGCGDR